MNFIPLFYQFLEDCSLNSVKFKPPKMGHKLTFIALHISSWSFLLDYVNAVYLRKMLSWGYNLLLQVLQEVLNCYSISEALFGKVCIIIDKVSCVIYIFKIIIRCKLTSFVLTFHWFQMIYVYGIWWHFKFYVQSFESNFRYCLLRKRYYLDSGSKRLEWWVNISNSIMCYDYTFIVVRSCINKN